MALILLAVWLLTRSNIGAVAAEAAPELLGGAEAGGAAEGGGMMKDFNDMPFGKIAGSMGGKLIHTITSAIGTHGMDERVNEGPVGTLA